MEVKVIAGDLASTEADALLVGLYEGAPPAGETADIDRALDGAVSGAVSHGEISGKRGQIALLHTFGKLPADRVAVIGLGKPADLTLEVLRSAVAEAGRFLRRKGVKSIAAPPLGVGNAGVTAQGAAHAIVEGAILGLYEFRQHITRPIDYPGIAALTLVGGPGNIDELGRGCRDGEIHARAASLARDLVNEPANYLTPARLAKVAATVAAQSGIEIQVLEREQVHALGMGAFLGVAQGSRQSPRFIIMRYRGRPSDEIDIALIGKGITFDSGGISLKPAEGMGDMKGDMAGGAAVIAAMGAVGRLKPAVNVMALVAATENMPGGNAIRPGDILTSMSGKTIEIISTDAEGRLTLADAISYARRSGARSVVDVATLTGACHIALGDYCTGAFGNNQPLMDRVIAAGNLTGERMWQMPMFEEYKEQNRSDVADIKNSGGRYGGAITAAQFLAEFAGETPWVHLDIAGTSDTDKERGYLVKGATGVPVRALISLVLGMTH